MNKYLKTNILFEDDDFVFINKTPGLLSIPDRFDHDKPNLRSMLKHHYGDIFTVHRLDMDTSGVIVFAKKAEAHALLSAIWQEGMVTKEYIAITVNTPPSTKGIIEGAIREHKTKKGTYVVSNLGKNSITDYTVTQSWEEYALLRLSLLTGRTHQIRVHLAYIGCPLLVDPAYGYQSKFYLSSIKKKKVNIKKGMEEKPLLKRTPLHAAMLKFDLPDNNGKNYQVEADLPKDMKAIKYQLDKRFGKVGL
ncbi:MAG: RluA family pseudouridine synthase [Saprospiraceae bacterium]